MSAQDKWKHFFREYHFSRLHLSYQVQANLREIMSEYRREAALERRLANAQRTIEAQAQRIAELEGYIDQHNQRVLQQDIVNKFLFHNS